MHVTNPGAEVLDTFPMELVPYLPSLLTVRFTHPLQGSCHRL